MTGDDRYTVPALARGLQLLTLFSLDKRELTGAELARRLKAPRASVFRLLHTLEGLGYVERCGAGPTYRLGIAVLRLGFEYLSSLDVTEHAGPLLAGLRDATGFSAHLVVRDAREVVFIAKAPSTSTLFQAIQVGARLPAHATVLGRVLLGDLDRAALSELFGTAPLTSHTAQTPTTIARLHAMVRHAHERGHGISEGGYESGISTIAAPVRGAHDRIVAAVSITVPAPTIDPTRAPDLIGHVLETARLLSECLRHLPHDLPMKRNQKLAA